MGVSIYDPIILGPLELRPSGIYGDAMTVELLHVDDQGEVSDGPQPYDANGGGAIVQIPVIVWEQAQDYNRQLRLI